MERGISWWGFLAGCEREKEKEIGFD